MSIKSTITLTREDCINRIQEEELEYARRHGRDLGKGLSDEELEDKLEYLRELNGYVCDNYMIKSQEDINYERRKDAQTRKSIGWDYDRDDLNLTDKECGR